MMECAECHHGQENHVSSICNGSLECFCEKFVPPVLFEFAQLVEKFKHQHRNVEEKCQFILNKMPPTRNAGEKSFAKIYREIWFGFKIRKDGTKLTTEEWKRMPHDDTINRAKRRVKHNHPELGTYNPKVLYEQTALFQALMELAVYE